MAYSHRPVLLGECLTALDVRPDGIYLDGTLGGGGHASEVLKRLATGRLIGIDRDPAALAAAGGRLAGDANKATLLRGNFHDARTLLRSIGVTALDGALLDLGVSSHQLDVRERGFSYHDDAPLDMRMDPSAALTAADIVNTWPERDLAKILREWGEENWAAQIARVLCDRRAAAPILTTAQLVAVVDAAIPKKFRQGDGSHPARRTFQALRIAVNDELLPLGDALRDIAEMLKPGGRLAVISFHSLEDRIVKQTFRDLAQPCVCPPEFPVCACGRRPTARLVNRKPIAASPDEVRENPRARSALLRAIEKLPSPGEEV